MGISKNKISFWHWFFRGSGGRPGIMRLKNLWLIMHILVGAGLAYLVKGKLNTTANTVLLPLAGIFIGLSFAWAGNAKALLQSSEMGEISKQHEGGFAEYVFVFQMAILIILITLVLWGLAGLGIFDANKLFFTNPTLYFVVKGILFAFSSLTLRECWHVVLGAQWMLLVQQELKSVRNSELKENESINAKKL